ncbi:hypothetical protein Ancab_006626 [Ancistrocladus abbreviatus]
MELEDRVDDRTFRVNFSVEGVAKLRDRVKDKLKEFMGDYTDDTLVEYVIVLLRNGRRKDEAKNELDVFLGDDSDSFVAWLWDHLASSVDQYIQSPAPDEASKTKPASLEQAVRSITHHMDSDSERVKSDKLVKSRHSREWKGPVRDVPQPPLCSSETDGVRKEGKTQRSTGWSRQSVSPEPPGQKKRRRSDEEQRSKRDAVVQATVGAPRRLLQFAVRDAVATSRPSNTSAEPALKRLRSVVSTSTVDSTTDVQPRRLYSVARVPSAVATVIKAVAEAAEDVRKVKPAGNVFDRLSCGADVPESTRQVSTFGDSAVEDKEYKDYDQTQGETDQVHLQRSIYSGKYIERTTLMESDTGLASDSASDNEGYDDVNVVSHRIPDVSQTGTSGGNKSEDSLMVQYSVAKNAGETMRPTRIRDQDQPVAVANTSRKIVNISVNVNTWKPPHYQPPREVNVVETQKSVQQSEVASGKSSVRFTNENSNPVTVNGNGKPAADTQNETQKVVTSVPGSFSTGRPMEDADSRTIFVNNVHFAATKDSLSRHFNKFGEVLKVIILTDAATGQPKGSAYVEFMRKEAAENALSLDGTSFMSRILKVVRKSNSHQEASSLMTWPRTARSASFPVPRFSRAPFPRAFPGAYRARPPIKPGARSLQWKRDSQPTSAEGAASASSGTNVISSVARGLTYVRTETKADGKIGAA